jgi:hypothetical protein
MKEERNDEHLNTNRVTSLLCLCLGFSTVANPQAAEFLCYQRKKKAYYNPTVIAKPMQHSPGQAQSGSHLCFWMEP